MWDRLIQAIVSEAGVTRDLGEIERSDRTILSLGLSPLPDGASLVTFADVTDRFRIETALRDRNDALEAADRLKSDFIKHVSYELRTPLNSILGFAEHLASGVPGGLNSRQDEYVGAIVEGSHTLRDLINDILDLALIESGALRLELERIDLYALLSDVAEHARDWAAKSGLTLELDCDPHAGLFQADPRRIRQIVFNLLSNAYKYTPPGGVIRLSGRIRARMCRSPSPTMARALRPTSKPMCSSASPPRTSRARARARASAWRWSTASWNCMTAGWRLKATAAPWSAVTSPAGLRTKAAWRISDAAPR